jgi:hypothetical protein
MSAPYRSALFFCSSISLYFVLVCLRSTTPDMIVQTVEITRWAALLVFLCEFLEVGGWVPDMHIFYVSRHPKSSFQKFCPVMRPLRVHEGTSSPLVLTNMVLSFFSLSKSCLMRWQSSCGLNLHLRATDDIKHLVLFIGFYFCAPSVHKTWETPVHRKRAPSAV